MNFFETRITAELYKKGRPDFYSNTFKRIQYYLSLVKKISNALDFVYGMGLSAKALLEIAVKVFGTDASQEMLNLARKKGKIIYLRVPAELQPFPYTYFNLITLGSDVHWFNIDKFLLEANRLLKSKGWLALYDILFISEMEGNPEFNYWYSNVYLKAFPPLHRNYNYLWPNEKLKQKPYNI